jgi:hypothetical protein
MGVGERYAHTQVSFQLQREKLLAGPSSSSAGGEKGVICHMHEILTPSSFEFGSSEELLPCGHASAPGGDTRE